GELEITDAVIIDGSTSGLGTVTITADAMGNDVLSGDGSTGLTVVTASEAVDVSKDELDNDGDGVIDESGEGLLDDNSRIFHITSKTADTQLKGLVLTGGFANGREQGGAVYSAASLTVLNSSLSGNSAGTGGGVYGLGAISLTNSTVSGNSAFINRGGGIYGQDAIALTNSTVSGNFARFAGGGVYGQDNVTLTNSTVSGNTAENEGGGIRASDAVTLTNSIVLGNIAVFYAEIIGTMDTSGGGNIVGEGS
ncbi:hypothetical protein E1297_01190, partial [Roseibium sp. RKSG952]|nr:hypothetical protein [Roseibium sp. RKSG952]